jgi:hypothetical protein
LAGKKQFVSPTGKLAQAPSVALEANFLARWKFALRFDFATACKNFLSPCTLPIRFLVFGDLLASNQALISRNNMIYVLQFDHGFFF